MNHINQKSSVDPALSLSFRRRQTVTISNSSSSDKLKYNNFIRASNDAKIPRDIFLRQMRELTDQT